MSAEPPVRAGVVAPALRQEFPALALRTVTLPGRVGPSTAGGRRRLASLADRIGGAQALAVRRQEVPQAYRVFFRHVGIDPDVTPTPIEAAILARLFDGGFPARERVADGCLVAVIETGVPVWALDADTLAGPLTLRPAAAGEPMGEGSRAHPPDLAPAGRLLVADEHGPVAPLFGPPLEGRAPGPRTERVCLFTVQVPGVSDLHMREALWTAAGAVQEGDAA